MNNDEIVQDFRRRYHGTYVRLINQEKRINVIASVRDVNAHSENLATLDLLTQEYGMVHTNMGSDEYEIRFDFPDTGVFQSGMDAAYVFRKAEKQYTRGFCPGNSGIMSVHHNITGRGVGSMSLKLVKAAFDHQTYTFRAALALFRMKRARSVALENNFSICLPFQEGGKGYPIFHKIQPVALVTDKGVILRMFEPVFKQSLEEILNYGRAEHSAVV
jgi:hypothetical protein